MNEPKVLSKEELAELLIIEAALKDPPRNEYDHDKADTYFAAERQAFDAFRRLIVTVEAQEKVIEAARECTRTGDWWKVSDALTQYDLTRGTGT